MTIIFTILLAIVSFKYSGSEHMPRVSYATILDAYILLVSAGGGGGGGVVCGVNASNGGGSGG